MARLRTGEYFCKLTNVQLILNRHYYGLREIELAQELGWHRRTVNNYLRILNNNGMVYKEGRVWYADI